MDYTLMHKTHPVAEITIDQETAVISKTGTVFDPRRVPIGVGINGGAPDRGDLNDWWQGRSIPASRQNIREAMNKLGVSTSQKLAVKCFGLSLSDQYWINPVNHPLEWADINFFCNTFSEDVGNILFGEAAPGKKISLVSPDNTSDGWLKKKWKIIDGKRYLIKGGSDPFHQQPINEAFASVVMARLGIPHVEYSVIYENGVPYSMCPNLVTHETELVSAFYIHNTKRLQNAALQYYHYIDCCRQLGIPNTRESTDQMLTVDYLIANTDRHYNNFGAVRNADTLEWIMPAPLYDNGSSLWYNKAVPGDDDKCMPFEDTHGKQIRLVKDFSWLNLSALAGIEEEFCEMLRPSGFIDPARRDALCRALRGRVDRLDKIV